MTVSTREPIDIARSLENRLENYCLGNKPLHSADLMDMKEIVSKFLIVEAKRLHNQEIQRLYQRQKYHSDKDFAAKKNRISAASAAEKYKNDEEYRRKYRERKKESYARAAIMQETHKTN